MSSPENPLKKYRSYAYKHILIASNSTDIIESFRAGEISTTSLSKSAFDTEERLFRVSTNKTGTAEYVVLINGMTDSEFIIDDVSWSSVMAPSPSSIGTSQMTTMAIDGKMTITEPKGFRFLEVLNLAHNSLRTDPNGMIFLLKTLFVGYPDDGGSPEIIPNILPLAFFMVDITADFTEKGAEYNLDFVALNNGAAKMPQYSDAIENIPNINLSTTGNSVVNVLKGMFSKINSAYRQHVNKVSRDMLRDGQRIEDNFRLVEYVIDIDPHYLGNANQYVVDDIQEQAQETAKNNDGVISLGPNMGIESAINTIMKKCSRVQKDADPAKTSDGKAYIFKVHSTVESVINKVGNPNTNNNIQGQQPTYKIIFIIKRYEVSQSPIDKALQGDTSLITPGNYLELNYFYTGRNVDIVKMDIKMEMGLAFFQTLQTNPNMGDATNYQKSNHVDASKQTPATAKNTHAQRRNLTPLFFSTKIKDKTTRHSKKPIDKSNFDSLLSKHAALESLETKITIHGNPILLNDLIITPSELRSTALRGRENQTIMADWSSKPGLVKVNISMPSTNDTRFVPKKFWFQGFYYLYSIENTFSQGQFLQNLEMLSIPQIEDVNIVSSNENEEVVDTKEASL